MREATGGDVRTWETQLRAARRAASLTVSVRVAPIRDRENTLTGFRWLLRDITEQQEQATTLRRLQAEQAKQLRTRTMELEAVVRMQDALLAESRAKEQTVQALVTNVVRALQHGAAPGPILGELLTELHAQGFGPSLIARTDKPGVRPEQPQIGPRPE